MLSPTRLQGLIEAAALAQESVGEARKAAGMQLVVIVGGASGPRCSLSVTAMDDAMLKLSDAAAHAAALRWGV